jgi:hypothetical protein
MQNSLALTSSALGTVTQAIASTREQMTRSIDGLTACQDQITRVINKLQAIGQQILRKNSELPPAACPCFGTQTCSAFGAGSDDALTGESGRRKTPTPSRLCSLPPSNAPTSAGFCDYSGGRADGTGTAAVVPALIFLARTPQAPPCSLSD